MKKLLFLGAISCCLLADTNINPNELPQNVQDFVKTHFTNENIVKAEKDWDSYEIKLSNGTELDFSKSGDIKEIDGKYSPIPDSIMQDVLKLAKENQKNAKLMEIEKEWNGYKLKFNNNYKVYIDNNGTITKTVLDD